MNIFRSKKLTKILPLITARYTILCTHRLQPPRDDSAARVQWFSSVYISLCKTCDPRGGADLLALVCDVYCDFVTFPFCILEQVWYLNVSIPDSCCLSYLENLIKFFRRFYNIYFWRLLLNGAIYAILIAGIIENRYELIFLRFFFF